MKHAIISIAVLFALITAFLPSNGFCDTGTYEIEDYNVTLKPMKNGYVEIDYYQKWRVTGGNIPWITVGMANSGYSIVYEKTGKNISKIKTSNSRGWFGVHITLDKKYSADQTFEVKFAVIQNGLFYARGDKYRLHFIPGWYDRAKINRMAVRLEFFAGLENVSAKPVPDRVEVQSFLWERSRLKKGAKFSVSVDFPKTFFSENIYLAKENKVSEREAPAFILFFIAALFIIIIIVFIIVVSAASGKSKYGRGGTIRTGGAKTGTYRPGCVVSCACACVSCACACACAGGGAAGCDRKLTLTCPLCKECKMKDCPVRHKEE